MYAIIIEVGGIKDSDLEWLLIINTKQIHYWFLTLRVDYFILLKFNLLNRCLVINFFGSYPVIRVSFFSTQKLLDKSQTTSYRFLNRDFNQAVVTCKNVLKYFPCKTVSYSFSSLIKTHKNVLRQNAFIYKLWLMCCWGFKYIFLNPIVIHCYLGSK